MTRLHGELLYLPGHFPDLSIFEDFNFIVSFPSIRVTISSVGFLTLFLCVADFPQ